MKSHRHPQNKLRLTLPASTGYASVSSFFYLRLNGQRKHFILSLVEMKHRQLDNYSGRFGVRDECRLLSI